MIKNYFKIAFRNLFRHKAYSLINISGLAIGMACSILILLWVRDELSYDRFNPKADRMYRLVAEASGFKAAVNPAGMPEGLKASMPQIESYVRLSHFQTSLFQVGAEKATEQKMYYVDSNFFELFSYRLLKGDIKTALSSPNAILISASMAKKYFGTEDPMGKALKKDVKETFMVTGILEDVPQNSHLQFDCLIPMSAVANQWGDLKTRVWDNFNFYSYLLLNKNFTADKASIKTLEAKIDKIYTEHVKELKCAFTLQPLTAIHLHSNYQVDIPGHGNVQYVNIFFVVAIFILIVACINFMNLATARSARRAKEVGLRKVVGAGRGQLIGQFLGESMLISIISFLLALGIVALLLPLFNNISGKQISIKSLGGGMFFLLLAIGAGTGLLAGIYPALFLSKFQPVTVLKGKLKSIGGNLIFRNALVVTQFVVSIVLLVGTTVVYNQLKFIQSRNLGFDKENLLYMSFTGDLWGKQDALKSALRENPLTSDYSIISDLPINLISGTVDVNWEGKDPKLQVIFPSMDVDENFFSVFRMKILNGRAFSTEFKSDSSNFILNEKALKVMGMKPETAVGKTFSMWGTKGTIVGVVQDFNYKPIQNPIEPLVLRLNRWGGYVMVRARAGSTTATINALGSVSQRLNPSYPYSYNFLDQDLASQYRGEQRMGKLFNLFAILGIFISCLGLYGLSAFLAEQRTKEIGVRKVLGASTFNIVYLLSGNFTRLILVAVIIAIPLSWFAAKSWLDSFAYRISINWVIFLVASLAALFIAWLTVSYESIKAALSNPATSLRTE